MLGSGQLGRMSGMAARRLGYRFVVLSPEADSPAGQIADASVVAPLDDEGAIWRLAQRADVLTYEFENVGAEPLQRATAACRVFPAPSILGFTQDRIAEKEALRRIGVPTTRFAGIDSIGDLEHALVRSPGPWILKTVRGGYDGKGQRSLQRGDDVHAAYTELSGGGGRRLILEDRVPFVRELSVIVARDQDGFTRTFPVAENVHRDGILHLSIAPARIDVQVAQNARHIAERIANGLGLVGVMGVEMFETPHGLYVNELAPRPHNSGHYTLDGCIHSQFDLHIQAVAGLPLGATDLLTPVVMLNLLGEHMEPLLAGLPEILSDPHLKLHLYGKSESRKGRKMGHLCAVDQDVPGCLARLDPVWKRLRPNERPLL